MTNSAPSAGRWWTIANGVRVDARDRERLAQLIYEAVVDEREACAKIADEHASHHATHGAMTDASIVNVVAAAIRARGA